MTTQTIEALTQELATVQKPPESPITLSFFHNKKKDWINLAEKEGAEIKIGEFDAEYSLKKAYLAHRISISGGEELKPNHFKVETQNLDGSWTEIQGEVDDSDKNILHFDLSQFIKKIKLSYKHKGFGLFSKVKLKSVNIRGWDKEGFDALESASDSFFSIENKIKELAKNEKARIDSANAALAKRETTVKAREDAIPQKEQASQQKLTELATQIKTSEGTLKDKEAEIKKKSSEVEKLTLSVASLTEKKDQNIKSNTELESQISDKKAELETTKQIAREENKLLQELLQKKSFYNETLADHKKETNKNIALNVVIMLVLAVGLGFLARFVLGFYEDSIHQIMTVDSTQKLWAIVSIRSAAGVLFGFIFTYGFGTLKSVFAKTYHLITDIRNIESKLIVARAVADTALKNSEASPDERRNFSAALSFAVLKNHFLNMSHESIVDDLDVDEEEVLGAMPRLPKNLIPQVKAGKTIETSAKSITH